MTFRNESLSKALVLLILATSFFLIRHVFSVVTTIESYTSLAGAMWIAGVVPYFLVVAGCILFLLNRTLGLPLIAVGTVLSFFGGFWSYIPYLPALSADPVTGFALTVIGNLLVLALLLWSVRRHSGDESVARSH